MFEERKLCLFLKEYYRREDLSFHRRQEATKGGVERELFMRYACKRWHEYLPEEVTETNIADWQNLREILEECIEDGYIQQETTKEQIESFRKHYLRLTSKGKKMVRWYYFWLKFLPEEFGDIKIVLFAVVGTMLTSPIWKPVFDSVGGLVTNLVDKLL